MAKPIPRDAPVMNSVLLVSMDLGVTE